MTTFGPTFYVDGPLPVPRPFGLLSAATLVDEPDERWANGVQVYGYLSDLPHGHDPCAGGTYRTKDDGTPPEVPTFGAFTAYVAEACSAMGIDTPEKFKARAAAVFSAVESYAVEQELSQGLTITGNPYLADANVSKPNGNTAVSAEEGLALMEDAIAGTARGGLIHATPGTVTELSKQFLVYRDGSTLRTVHGTPVSAGAGYLGAAPPGAPAVTATKQWMWATGPVQIRRSEMFMMPDSISDALDRENNLVVYRAERNYLAIWDTVLQSGVLVDRST